MNGEVEWLVCTVAQAGSILVFVALAYHRGFRHGFEDGQEHERWRWRRIQR